jgi:hypothetical protein
MFCEIIGPTCRSVDTFRRKAHGVPWRKSSRASRCWAGATRPQRFTKSTEDLVATGVQWYANSLFATAAGIASACAREWTRAEAHHQLAIRQADAAYRICQPQARVWYADMLLSRAAAGDRDRAQVLLSEALSLYESIGLPGFAQRTSARLAATAG